MADQNFSVGLQTDTSAFERGWNRAIGLLGTFATQASTSGTQVAQAVSQINGGNYAPLQRSLGAAGTAFNQLADRARFAGFQVAYYAGNANSLLTDAYRQADKEQTRFDAGLGRLGNNLQSAGRSLSTYLTAPLIGAGIAAFGTYAKIDSLNRALTVIEGPAGNASARFKELREVAALPGLGLEEAVQGDVRLRAVGLSAKLSKASLLEFGNAIALTGGGKAELGSVTTQLGQMAAKGKVLAQDLRPIIEAAPAVAQSIKNLFGTIDSESISDKLKVTGKTSTDFIELITKEMSKLERISGGPKNAIENLSDSMKIASYEFGLAADKSFDLTGKLNGLGTFINGLASGFKELSPGTQAAILGLIGTAAAIGPLALGLGTVIRLIPTMTTGFTAMRTAMIAMTGPIGIIAGAVAVVGALAYSLYQFNQAATFTIDRSKLLADASKDVNTQIGAETANLRSLITVAKDETISKQARQAAIEKVNAIAPEYLKNITLDTINTNAATGAIERYTKVLTLKAQAQVYAQRQADAIANAAKARATPVSEFADGAADWIGAAFTNMFKGGIAFNQGMAESLINKGIERQRAEITKANQESKLWANQLNKVNVELAKTEIKPTIPAGGGGVDFTKVGQAAGIKKAKDEMKGLAEQIQSGNLAGQDTSALQARYDKLAGSIDKATDSTRKHRAASTLTKELSELATLESIYVRLGNEIQKQSRGGRTAPDELYNQRSAIGAKIEEQKARLTRTKLPTAQEIKEKKDPVALSNALSGVMGQNALPKGMAAMVMDFQIKARFDLIDREKSYADLQAQLSGALADTPGFVAKMAGWLSKQLADAFGSGQLLDPFNNAISALLSGFSQAKQGLAAGMMGVFESLGAAVGGGGNIIGTLLKGVLDMIGNYLITVGTALITSALLLETNPFTAVFGTAQGLQGAAMIAGGGLVKGLGSVMKFAKGGVFDQPTFGLFGEYAGAGRNREIATPEKLMAETFRGELQKDAFRQTPKAIPGGQAVREVPYFASIGVKMGELRVGLERENESYSNLTGS